MSLDGESLVAIRRDLHERPEAGWTEFRTTALVAAELDRLGFDLHLGADAVEPDARLGVPPEDELAAAEARAREAGAPESYLDRMDGITGLVAVKRYGDGPTVGVRVDMDALERQEAMDDDHRPAREGFASAHPGEMHACAHDGHTAIGVGIARELAD
jgi:aminobenzoyl-glutamate utilization protein A